MKERVSIKSLEPEELESWVLGQGERPFRARQLLKWVYGKAEGSFGQMSDLSGPFREMLKSRASIDEMALAEELFDPDGTRKFIFDLKDGLRVESVAIPEGSRLTLCVSSQVGCQMGCTFCLTGKMGFFRNLSTGEIVDQVVLAKRALRGERKITNIVFMGMGEPLANLESVVKALKIISHPQALDFSCRRITVSTAGLTDKIERLGSQTDACLAVSINAPDEETRSRIMPVNRAYPLEGLMDALKRYPLQKRRRITMEYVLIEGLNDSIDMAKRLIRLVHGLRVKVNLIPLNPHPDIPHERPSDERIAAFRDVLSAARITAMVRESRGAEIGAACGLLGPKNQEVA